MSILKHEKRRSLRFEGCLFYPVTLEHLIALDLKRSRPIPVYVDNSLNAYRQLTTDRDGEKYGFRLCL